MGSEMCIRDSAEVERTTGRRVPEIFERDGEAAFRREESRVLREAASGGDHVVVSVAGGAVLEEVNREVIAAAGTVVWLRATIDTLVRRVGSGRGRPLLAPDPRAALVRLDGIRRPLYAAVADLVVDVDELAAPEVVERIAGSVEVADA